MNVPILRSRALAIALVAAVVSAAFAILPGGSAADLPAGTSVAPSAAEWLQAAETGSPLVLTVDDVEYTLLVAEDRTIFGDGFFAHDAAGHALDLTNVRPLQGRIVGIEESIVAVTVSPHGIMGVASAPSLGEMVFGRGASGLPLVTSPDLQVQLPTKPLAEPRTVPAYVAHEDAHGDHGTDLAVNPPPVFPLGLGRADCLQLTPHQVAHPMGLVSGFATREFDVSFAVDDDFTAHYGPGWPAVAVSWINVADAVYQRDVQLRVVMTDIHAHGASLFTTTNSDTLLDEMAAHYASAHASLARENAHLFTGVEVANALGQANCIGGAGTPSIAYTMGQAANFEPIRFLGLEIYGDGYSKILTHELGHILSAHHHYGNCAESAPFFQPSRPMDTCTLMFPYVDGLTLKFGSMNRLVMRGWADRAQL